MVSPDSQPLRIIAPPPLLYLGTLALGLAAHLLFPLAALPNDTAARWLGAALFAAGAGLARWSFVTMRHLGTSADPRRPSEALATHGPFGLSRNPIYLAQNGLYAGLALLANALWPLLLLVPLLALMEWGVIRREERYLTAKFGAPYREYMNKVRRWL